MRIDRARNDETTVRPAAMTAEVATGIAIAARAAMTIDPAAAAPT